VVWAPSAEALRIRADDLKAGPLMIGIAHRELIHECKEPARRVHWGAGLVAIDEEHQTIRFAVDVREHRLVATRQTRRRLEIHRVDAAKELPLVRRELDQLAVVARDRGARPRDPRSG